MNRLVGLPAELTGGLSIPTVPTASGPFSIRQVAVQGGDASGALADLLIVVYSSSTLDPSATVVDLFAQGGAIVKMEPTTGHDGKLVAGVAGSRASLVSVSEFEAALIQSDEIAPGLRQWGIYWSDGKIDYSIESSGSAHDVVVAARAMMCS
jgi:hypothetical protein